MNKLLCSIVIVLVIECGYQYTLLSDASERLDIAHDIAKDTMAASLQQGLLSIELLQIQDKEFVNGVLTEQAHAEYKNVIKPTYSLQSGDTVMVKRALDNYSNFFSGGRH